MKNPTLMGSRCSMADFNNSTSYKSFSTELSLLNSGSLISLWVFLAFRCFVIVCLDLSMIWYPYEELSKSFIVSATTPDKGFFLSPSLLASTTDWTKLLKHFRGEYWILVHFGALQSKFHIKVEKRSYNCSIFQLETGYQHSLRML